MRTTQEIINEIKNRIARLAKECRKLDKQNTPYAGMVIGEMDGLSYLLEWIQE